MKFQLGSENRPLIRRIENSIKNGRISHAYLVEGPAYIDKPAFAISFIKGILCPRGMGDNCGNCPICDKIDHDNHEDIIFVRRLKTKQTIGIGQIREMQKQVRVKPNGDRYVVVIEESGLMTEEAQNCLLKTLEEPPGETVLILLTDNSQDLLPTIRSRCVKYRLEGLSQNVDRDMQDRAEELLKLILGGGPFYRMKKVVGDIGRDREQAAGMIDYCEARCRELILSKDARGVPIDPSEISRCVDGLEEARTQLSRGLKPAFVLNKMLLKIGG